jgi:hypothetical protein
MSWFSAYAAWALAGAMKLARFDASGMNHFEISTEGFWRSFLAAAIVAPFFGMLLILRHFDADGGGQFLHNLILEFETYAISWLVFPLVMAGFTQLVRGHPECRLPADRHPRPCRHAVVGPGQRLRARGHSLGTGLQFLRRAHGASGAGRHGGRHRVHRPDAGADAGHGFQPLPLKAVFRPAGSARRHRRWNG